MSRYLKTLKLFIGSNSIIKYLIFKRFLNRVGFSDLLLKYDITKYKAPVYANIERIINIGEISNVLAGNSDLKILTYLCDMYVSHRFNILGSGWVSADYTASPLGFHGSKYQVGLVHRPYESAIKEKTDKSYSPIDWQRDIKSGYLFNVNEPSFEATKNLPRGVDLKIPWELARMHHLPQMALASTVLDNKKEKLLQEFKDQVIDFCQSNPIGYGVNWSCPMDVSIRVVNLLVAYDLFEQQDTKSVLDEDFKQYFLRKIIEHGRFIVRNLEKNILNDVSGNHYLSNLCGLLFVSSYIKNSETEKWFDFAKEEFLNEFDKQFLDDGGNYECSTAYHRLSAEISVYCFALLIRNNVNIERRLLKKLNSVALFATMTRRPDGTIIQIGDNDSGRLLKLNLKGKFIPISEYEKQYLDKEGYEKIYKDKHVFVENELTVDSIISAIYSITRHEDLKKHYDESPLEGKFIDAILNGNNGSCDLPYNKNFVDKQMKEKPINLNEMGYSKVTHIKLNSEIDLSDVKLRLALEFGLVVYEKDDFRLFVRSPANLSTMSSSHLHNDFLHFEISNGTRNYFCDQGSYIYTPLIDIRNEFRSIKAHNAPYHYKETNVFKGCFDTDIRTKGSIVELTGNSVGMLVKFDDIIHYRRIELKDNIIVVADQSNKPFTYNSREFNYTSSGYGKLSPGNNNNDGIEIITVIEDAKK